MKIYDKREKIVEMVGMELLHTIAANVVQAYNVLTNPILPEPLLAAEFVKQLIMIRPIILISNQPNTLNGI